MCQPQAMSSGWLTWFAADCLQVAAQPLSAQAPQARPPHNVRWVCRHLAAASITVKGNLACWHSPRQEKGVVLPLGFSSSL